MAEDLISIIVPVYNVEKYLKECIDSLICQSYSNIEIILIDDGSIDSSGKICDDYKNLDVRVKVIHKSNGGMSEARNVGLSEASGAYIAFVDSDDIVGKDYILYLFELLKSNDADVSVCRYRYIDDDGKIIGSYGEKDTVNVRGKRECMKKFLCDEDIGTVVWGKLYKKELFSDLCFPVGKYHEDVYISYKIVDLCNCIAIGNTAEYYYRQHESSIVHKQFVTKHLDAVDASIERAEFIHEKYSDLYGIASIYVIYAANFCVKKLIATKGKFKKEIQYLQAQYKKYGDIYRENVKNGKSRKFVGFAQKHLSLMIKLCKLFKRFF